MMKSTKLSPIAAAIGTAFAVNLSAVSLASAAENPFASHVLQQGYQLAESHGGKHEGKCGEGKCGMARMMDADKDGKVTRAEFMTAHEHMFTKMDANGDGAIAGDEMKGHKDGKCGEGKCGANNKP
jgi:uncharacterized low-complexity protein